MSWVVCHRIEETAHSKDLSPEFYVYWCCAVRVFTSQRRQIVEAGSWAVVAPLRCMFSWLARSVGRSLHSDKHLGLLFLCKVSDLLVYVSNASQVYHGGGAQGMPSLETQFRKILGRLFMILPVMKECPTMMSRSRALWIRYFLVFETASEGLMKPIQPLNVLFQLPRIHVLLAKIFVFHFVPVIRTVSSTSYSWSTQKTWLLILFLMSYDLWKC